MMNTRLRKLFMVLATSAAACASAQTPFSLDASFRTLIQHEYVNSVLPLVDGKVIASGVMRFPEEMSDKRLVRLLPTGLRDETFYNSGLGGGKIVQWQNRFYVAGALAVRRIIPATGQNDNTFALGTTGIPYFSPLQSGDFHVFPDGRVLLGGSHTVNYPAGGYSGQHQLIWFTNTGYLDTTRVHRKGNGAVMRFCELPDGRFICSGFATQFDGRPVDRIFRVHADGAVDTTFSTGAFTGLAVTFLPLPDGRVYAGGNFKRSANPEDTLRLVRFMPDGALDPSFTMPHFNQGVMTYPDGPTIGKITPYQDGKLFVMGNFQYVNGQPRRGICVIDSTGALTDLFDDCGVGLFTFMGITNGSLSGILPHGENHWVVWGSYTGYDDGTVSDLSQRFVTRLHVGDFTTGAAPLSLGEGSGVRVYPNPSTGTATLQLEQVPHNAQVLVRDALGREVLRQRVGSHYTTLTLGQSGVYLVELWSEGQRMATQRLVVE